MDSVEGAIAVFRGAGSGIGRVTSLALAARGCAIVATDLDEARAAAVAEDIATQGGRALGLRCDVSRDANVAAVYDATLSVIAMTDGLGLYLRPKGIGVSCFCPAGVVRAAPWTR